MSLHVRAVRTSLGRDNRLRRNLVLGGLGDTLPIRLLFWRSSVLGEAAEKFGFHFGPYKIKLRLHLVDVRLHALFTQFDSIDFRVAGVELGAQVDDDLAKDLQVIHHHVKLGVLLVLRLFYLLLHHFDQVPVCLEHKFTLGTT